MCEGADKIKEQIPETIASNLINLESFEVEYVIENENIMYAKEKGASLPTTSKPNSTKDLLNPDGTIKQRRIYDNEGKALKDIDYNHGGNEEFPHEHDWTWNGDNPNRGTAKPVSDTDKIEESYRKGVLIDNNCGIYIVDGSYYQYKKNNDNYYFVPIIPSTGILLPSPVMGLTPALVF